LPYLLSGEMSRLMACLPRILLGKLPKFADFAFSTAVFVGGVPFSTP
jgi:hypothetical protein